MSTVDEHDDRPVAEPACNAQADFHHVPRDTSRVVNHDLCQRCFPDDEVPDDLDWFLKSRGTWGSMLHKSTDDGSAEFEIATVDGPSLAEKLSDPDVTSVEQLQRGEE